MRRRLQYADSPDPKPKSSVINAVPIAMEGSSLSTMMNSGEKNTAPPIPLAMATVEMAMAAGKRNQYSALSVIVWLGSEKVRQVAGPEISSPPGPARGSAVRWLALRWRRGRADEVNS